MRNRKYGLEDIPQTQPTVSDTCRYIIKDNLSFKVLEKVSLKKAVDKGITPVISLGLVSKVLKYGDSQVKQHFLDEVLDNKEHIETTGYKEGESEELRYYKYLKGMRVFLELDCIGQSTIREDIENEEDSHDISVTVDKDMMKRLKTVYNLREEDVHRNTFSVKGINSKITISKQKVEDYIFFKHCWYTTKEFTYKKNMFGLEDLLNQPTQGEFKFNLKNLDEILNGRLAVFDMFCEEHNKNIFYKGHSEVDIPTLKIRQPSAIDDEEDIDYILKDIISSDNHQQQGRRNKDIRCQNGYKGNIVGKRKV